MFLALLDILVPLSKNKSGAIEIIVESMKATRQDTLPVVENILKYFEAIGFEYGGRLNIYARDFAFLISIKDGKTNKIIEVRSSDNLGEYPEVILIYSNSSKVLGRDIDTLESLVNEFIDGELSFEICQN